MQQRDEPALLAEALSDKELEVLRLLTAGHTIKTIAARLGRSEASINERLRDARRKTGAGSSRELARRLAAQKTWDRNTDLSERAAEADAEIAPSASGGALAKGTVIVSIIVALAAAGLVLSGIVPAGQDTAPSQASSPAPSAAPSTADRPLPVEGRWALDTARIPANERPQSVILDFRLTPERVWIGRSEIVAADGTRQTAETRVAADGVPAPLSGAPFADMVSARQPAANTLVLTFTRNGDPVSTRVYTVTGDGDAMTETIVWAHDTDQRMVTTYFTRTG